MSAKHQNFAWAIGGGGTAGGHGGGLHIPGSFLLPAPVLSALLVILSGQQLYVCLSFDCSDYGSVVVPEPPLE